VRAYGSAFWSVFNACPHQLAWYYAAVEAVVGDNLANQAAVRALSAAVHDLIEVAGVPRPVASAEPPACDCN
jgi:hypothetical protein